jgi:hypothetical protein
MNSRKLLEYYTFEGRSAETKTNYLQESSGMDTRGPNAKYEFCQVWVY